MKSTHLSWDDFFALQRFGMTLNLDNTHAFCERLGHPEGDYPSILVSGTNGKGTVVSIIESILRNSGMKTGKYISPHISSFNERIQMGGSFISDEEVFLFLEEHWEFIKEKGCTFFETATAMALNNFSRRKIDIAVVEVGLGGTWDATAVVKQILSIITPIDYDHTDRLGDTLPQIAADKAGIFRAKTPALIADQQLEVLNVLKDKAQKLGIILHKSSDLVSFSSMQITPSGIETDWQDSKTCIAELHFPLTGYFQVENLRTALAAALILKSNFHQISHDSIARGITDVSWPGRMQQIKADPAVILDVGHNPAAIRGVVDSVRKIWKPDRIVTIFSALKYKDIAGMYQILGESTDQIYLVPLNTARGYSKEELQTLAGKLNWKAQMMETVSAALSRALGEAGKNDLILITGSHYLAEEVLKIEEYS